MNLLAPSAPFSTPRPPGAKLHPGSPPMVEAGSEAAKAQEAHTGEETGDRSLVRPAVGRERRPSGRSLLLPQAGRGQEQNGVGEKPVLSTCVSAPQDLASPGSPS